MQVNVRSGYIEQSAVMNMNNPASFNVRENRIFASLPLFFCQSTLFLAMVHYFPLALQRFTD